MRTQIEYQCKDNEHKLIVSYYEDLEQYSEIYIPNFNVKGEKTGYAVVGLTDLKAALALAGLEIVKKPVADDRMEQLLKLQAEMKELEKEFDAHIAANTRKT